MDFDIKKYMGQWFEIARIPNEFEPDLTNVTAEYTLTNTGIHIKNQGYKNGELKVITGTAKTTHRIDLLFVTFDNKHYSYYNILAFTDDYSYALVGGEDKNHLWILGRKNYITSDLYTWFINVAKNNEYNIDNLKISK
jgi:lipocalin